MYIENLDLNRNNVHNIIMSLFFNYVPQLYIKIMGLIIIFIF